MSAQGHAKSVEKIAKEILCKELVHIALTCNETVDDF